MKDKEEIKCLVSTALDAQFEMYSFCDMIEDIDVLTKEEKEWAKNNLTYGVEYA